MNLERRSPSLLRLCVRVALAAWLAVSVGQSTLPAQSGVGDFTFTTIAGVVSSAGSADGPRLDARFDRPESVAVAPNGDVYVADTMNHVIRRVSAAGEVTTVAGLAGYQGFANGQGSAARFNRPNSVTVDASGVVFVSEQYAYAIRRVAPDGTVTTFAGSPEHMGYVDGPADIARFGMIVGLTIDAAGTIVVADYSYSTIRRVAPDGSVTTLATEIPSSDALVWHPNGTVYVAGTSAIRSVSSTGVVAILAGSPDSTGSADGPGPLARFTEARGIAVAQDGTLVVTDSSNSRLRRVTTAGDTTTIAGTGLAAGGDGTGQHASVNRPFEIAARPDGVLVFADTYNNAIRTLGSGNQVTMYAGSMQTPGHGDGPGVRSLFSWPRGIAIDPDGVVYATDSATHTIRAIGVDGTVSTIAGSAWMPGSNNGVGSDALFRSPKDVAVGPDGSLFVADSENHTIRRIDSSGSVSLVAGVPGSPAHANGPAATARFNNPEGIAADSAGNLYVADRDNNAIRLVNAGGFVTTVAGGSLGDADGSGSAARFYFPTDLAIGPDGNLYIADRNGIRRMTPAGEVVTIARDPSICPAGCLFTGIAVDAAGVIYTTSIDSVVRQIHPSGAATVIGGVPNNTGASDGVGSAARFSNPTGIVTRSDGSLYVADGLNGRILRGVPPAPQLPVVVGHPLTATATAGQSATFVVTAKGYPAPSLQWQVSSNGSTWTDVTDTTGVVGSRHARLRLSSLPVQWNGRRFRCVVTNSFGSATSDAGMLHVVGPASAGPSSLHFAARKNGPSGALTSVTAPQQVTVTFAGHDSSWYAYATVPWLQVTGGSGTGSGTFTVSVVNPGNTIGGSTLLTDSVYIFASSAPMPNLQLPITLTIDQSGAESSPPFGQVDTPAQNATNIQGAIGLTGWALDDIGVASVRAYRPCLAFDNPASCQDVDGYNVVYLADGVFLSGARPDLETAFPQTPLNYRAGWGVQILSPMLPHLPNGQLFGGQGTMPIFVFATDHDGRRTLLGRSTPDHTPTFVALNNDAIAKPFGTIDTPTLGQTVSGTIANFGWAVTPDSNTIADGTDILIPTSGGSMYVFIDGVTVGSVVYNQCRGLVGSPVPAGQFCDDDVANIFGNITPAAPLSPRFSNPTRFRNLDEARGPQASFVIDTRALANGLHTIAWSVRDSADRIEGIGSRFFTVLNGDTERGSTPRLTSDDRPRVLGRTSDIADRRARRADVMGRTGFDVNAPMQIMRPEPSGARTARLDQQDRLELALGAGVTAGYLVVGDQLRDLPIGSALDTASGVFTWVPPIGYFGAYSLTFVAGDERVVVDVTVGPRAGEQTGSGGVRMHIDAPIDGATTWGPLTISGWALDPRASLGAGVSTVHVWANRRGFDEPVFLGEATLGVERPDVESAFGRGFGASGFTLTTTATALRPGTYEVTAYVWSARTRRWEDARTIRVTIR